MRTAVLIIIFNLIFFQELKSQELVAHRGYSAIAPENTLFAIDEALKFGYNILELDLRVTADDSLVILHDLYIDRTSNSTGKVSSMTYESLTRINFNYPEVFGTKYGFAKIPSLYEALIKLKGKNLILDLKVSNRIPDVLKKVQQAKFDPDNLSFLVQNFKDAKSIVQLFPTSTIYFWLKKEEHFYSDVYLNFYKEIGINGLLINNHSKNVNARVIQSIKDLNFKVTIWNYSKLDEIKNHFFCLDNVLLLADDPDDFDGYKSYFNLACESSRQSSKSFFNQGITAFNEFVFFQNFDQEVMEEYTIYKIDGEVMAERRLSGNNSLTIPLLGFSSGVYIIKLKTDLKMRTLKFSVIQ